MSVDAPVDVAIDAPVDAPAGPASRIWIDGDYITDGATIAGSFSDRDALPVMPPALASSLGTACQFPNQRFDATATKITFPANPSDPTQAALYVADADGLNATQLVATQTGVTVACVALSPDSTKVAFSMNSAARSDLWDVYVVDTTGTGAPVRVSPDYMVTGTPTLAWANQLTWSADSRYVGFTGDFIDGGIGAYIADTASLASPTTAAMFSNAELQSTNDVRSKIVFDANDHPYAMSTVTAPAYHRSIYTSGPDAQNRVELARPLRGDGTTSWAVAPDMSPDGHTIVFVADAPIQNTYEVYASPTATWNPIAVTANSPAGQGIGAGYGMHFSPDGTSLAFVAASSGTVYKARLDGSGTSRLAQFTSPQALWTLSDWTLDGTGLYVCVDPDGSRHWSLYRLDTQRVDQTPVLAVAPPTGGDVYNALIRPM